MKYFSHQLEIYLYGLRSPVWTQLRDSAVAATRQLPNLLRTSTGTNLYNYDTFVEIPGADEISANYYLRVIPVILSLVIPLSHFRLAQHQHQHHIDIHSHPSYCCYLQDTGA